MQGMKFVRGVVFGCAIAFAAQVYGQTGSAVVTVQRKAGNADPIQQENVLVFENGKRAPITLWAPLTGDHGLAAKALRLPQSIRGGGSPYFTLSSVSQQWPAEAPTARRAVLMITDGIDRYGDPAFNADNPYVTKAIADAQRAQILVYTLYYRGAGALSYDPVASNGGQNYLVQLSQETGGKCLYSGTG